MTATYVIELEERHGFLAIFGRLRSILNLLPFFYELHILRLRKTCVTHVRLKLYIRPNLLQSVKSNDKHYCFEARFDHYTQ